jgi:hypothetical protein
LFMNFLAPFTWFIFLSTISCLSFMADPFSFVQKICLLSALSGD